jgi:hypothetical protein
MNETSWLDDFDETCQAILEDAFLLDALSMYISSGGEFTCGGRADCFPQVFRRLCDYLSQHAADLHGLRKQIGPDL